MLSRKKKSVFHESLLETTVSVLFEESAGSEIGLSDEYVRVRVPSRERLTNQLLPVTITGHDGGDCIGVLQMTGNSVEMGDSALEHILQ
jgi:hypothetical protein